MNNLPSSNLKVIRISDPLMCVRCDNAYIADVLTGEGSKKKMFYCGRLDCDNWCSTGACNEQSLDQAA